MSVRRSAGSLGEVAERGRWKPSRRAVFFVEVGAEGGGYGFQKLLGVGLAEGQRLVDWRENALDRAQCPRLVHAFQGVVIQFN